MYFFLADFRDRYLESSASLRISATGDSSVVAMALLPAELQIAGLTLVTAAPHFDVGEMQKRCVVLSFRCTLNNARSSKLIWRLPLRRAL